MNPKAAHTLLFSLILMVGYLSPAQAVSDAELEALEKQIEQLESEEKKQAEAAAKRKAEERKAELEKQRLEEEKRIIKEEKMKIEEARLAELERKRQEEETKKKAEEEKKEKYNLLITEAERAVIEKDKNIAINKYKEALLLYPNNAVASDGLNRALVMVDKTCFEIIGTWTVFLVEEDTDDHVGDYQFNNDGSVFYLGSFGKITRTRKLITWECRDPSSRIFYVFFDYTQTEKHSWDITLSQDGKSFDALDSRGYKFKANKGIHEETKELPTQQNPLSR